MVGEVVDLRAVIGDAQPIGSPLIAHPASPTDPHELERAELVQGGEENPAGDVELTCGGTEIGRCGPRDRSRPSCYVVVEGASGPVDGVTRGHDQAPGDLGGGGCLEAGDGGRGGDRPLADGRQGLSPNVGVGRQRSAPGVDLGLEVGEGCGEVVVDPAPFGERVGLQAGVHGKPARTWPLPFLVRPTAHHVMDHAWELEDRDTSRPHGPAAADPPVSA
jgi:hypothetical protein